ncbi:MAG: DNA ligase, partial [Gammaproteobacteria bacterium]
PDWCILDLDPKEAPFKHVVTIAKHIHGMCEDIGLPNFIKTTGSSGLHVLIPLGAQYPYEQCRNLAHLIATVVSAELPDIATIVRSPAKREGKVYVDYGQNGHGRLLVSPFCVRPFPGAPMSMPMRWSEVTGRLKSSQHYTIKNAIRRMKTAKTDPMSDVLKLKPDLMDALARLREHVQSA